MPQLLQLFHTLFVLTGIGVMALFALLIGAVILRLILGIIRFIKRHVS